MSGRVTAHPGQSRCLVPALDAEAKFSSRLSARSALYTELRLLLDGLDEPFSATTYRQLVLEKNRLARPSSSSRRKLWKELRSRYILDRDHPLFSAFWSEWAHCETEPQCGLTAYVFFALNDRLVADLGTQWLFPYLRRAPTQILVEDVLGFIQRAATNHVEVAGWSDETRKSVARHYMASIRDFGLARGKVKKFTVRPAGYAAPIRLLIKGLRLAGAKPLEIIQAKIFRLLGLDGSEVIDALGELNRKGDLLFKIQADVVELDLEAA